MPHATTQMFPTIPDPAVSIPHLPSLTCWRVTPFLRLYQKAIIRPNTLRDKVRDAYTIGTRLSHTQLETPWSPEVRFRWPSRVATTSPRASEGPEALRVLVDPLERDRVVVLQVLDLLEEGAREGRQIVSQLVALPLQRGAGLPQLRELHELRLAAARRSRAAAAAAAGRCARLLCERDCQPVALALERGVGVLQRAEPCAHLRGVALARARRGELLLELREAAAPRRQLLPQPLLAAARLLQPRLELAARALELRRRRRRRRRRLALLSRRQPLLRLRECRTRLAELPAQRSAALRLRLESLLRLGRLARQLGRAVRLVAQRGRARLGLPLLLVRVRVGVGMGVRVRGRGRGGEGG